jgi:8-oxo-dGTP pyrophosphatase MutT (NUDIX family)
MDWKKLSFESIFENKWIRLDKHDVIDPSGNSSIYTVVHFQNLAVGCIPIDDEGYIYLVGQWRFPFDKYSWEIPLGGADFNLDPLEECKRELKEETGIEAEGWEELLRSDLSNSVTDERSIIYVCKNLKLGNPNPEDTEKLQIKKIKFEEALKMVMDGTITDSLSMMAILKLAVFIFFNKEA